MRCPDIDLILYIPAKLMVVGPDGILRTHIVMEERSADIYSRTLLGNGRGWYSGGEHPEGNEHSGRVVGDGVRSNLSTYEFSQFGANDDSY